SCRGRATRSTRCHAPPSRFRRPLGAPRKIADHDLVRFDVRLSRLLGLAIALPVFAACYPAEEGSPAPFGTTPANDRSKPSETQNATLPDHPTGENASAQPGGTGGAQCAKNGLAKGAAQSKAITVNGEERKYVLSVPQAYGELPQA